MNRLLRSRKARPRHRRLRLLLWAVAASVGLAVSGGVSALAATPTPSPSPTPPPPPSAIGNEAVVWIAVSPAYMHTGTVVAASASLNGCPSKTNCSHIWVTHDGGYSWKQAAAQGWAGIHPAIAVDNAGHEVIFGAANNGVLRSDDDGNTWKVVGEGGGTPTPEPSYPSDQGVAVAGHQDYVLRGAQSQNVSGSGGAMSDATFGLAPSFPTGGSNPAALLGGMDPKTGLPAVETCDAHLSCSSEAILNGAGPMAGPPNMYLSPNFVNDGTAFAQTASGVFRTSNGGRTFTPVNVGAAGATATSTAMLALAPHFDGNGASHTAYAAVLQAFGSGKNMKRSGGVYRSADAGLTWSIVGNSGPLSDGSLAVAVAPDGRIFASYLTNQGQGGLLCSTDGTTWLAFCPAVGDAANGSHGTGARPGSSCTTGSCSGVVANSNQTATSTSSGEAAASNGTSDAGAPPTATNLAGTHESTPSRPWMIPLIIAAVLAVAAAVAGPLRRRLSRPASS